MAGSKLVIAQLNDGKFVAASTSAPFFCTVGDTVDAVRTRANEAARFYREGVAANPVVIAPRVSTFERVVPHQVDAWLADAVMR